MDCSRLPLSTTSTLHPFNIQIMHRLFARSARSLNRVRARVELSVPRLYSTPASFSNTIISPTPTFFSSVHPPTEQPGSVYTQIPAFRCLDGEGSVLSSVSPELLSELERIPAETLSRIYETMTLLPGLDTLLSSSQRQGRISFYMTSYGEEGGECSPEHRRARLLADPLVSQLLSAARRRGSPTMRCLRSTGRLVCCSTEDGRKPAHFVNPRRG